MNQQLALSLYLNRQSTLQDFCWEGNGLLEQQLKLSLTKNGERFLYLWGEPGSGKSHILQGACHEMGQKDLPSTYVPLSILKEWGPESIEDIEGNALIAIDDLDCIGQDPIWEEALLHLYNRVRDNGKTIFLMAGRQAPTAPIIQLPDLRSRLAWGLVFQVNELDDDLKIMALQHRAEKKGFQLSSSAAFFLLTRSTRNMHDLYQILDKLDEASLKAQRKITIPFIKSILGI